MPTNSTVFFILKVLGLSSLIFAAMLVVCVVSGLLLYIALDPILAASDLAAFMLFFGPFALVGVPSVIAAARLALLRRRPWLVAGLLGATFVLGTLGFSGFMVGAMGI